MFALMHGRSFDQGQLTLIQHIFLGNNIYDLDNIDKLPVKGATVYVMPMKIKGGSSGPTRIIAHTRKSAQVVTDLQTSCTEVVVKPISGCVRTACSQLL
jgi:hypothetical protein